MRFHQWNDQRPESWPEDLPYLTERGALAVADAERCTVETLLEGTAPGPNVVALVGGRESHNIGGWSISLYLDTGEGFDRVVFDDSWSRRARAGYARTRDTADRWEWEAPAAICRGLAAMGALLTGPR